MRGSTSSRLVRSSLAMLAGLVALSCEQVVVTAVPAHRVDIAPPTAFVKVNETTLLTVTVLSREGHTLSGRPIAWASLNPDIATVDDAGTVRGVAPGVAMIQATTEGTLGTASVTV